MACLLCFKARTVHYKGRQNKCRIPVQEQLCTNAHKSSAVSLQQRGLHQVITTETICKSTKYSYWPLGAQKEEAPQWCRLSVLSPVPTVEVHTCTTWVSLSLEGLIMCWVPSTAPMSILMSPNLGCINAFSLRVTVSKTCFWLPSPNMYPTLPGLCPGGD